MSNTLSVKALPNGLRRVTVHSKGERDMSADLSTSDLQAAVDQAHNDQARGAYAVDAPEVVKAKSAAK